jgi:hypothetical protein
MLWLKALSRGFESPTAGRGSMGRWSADSVMIGIKLKQREQKIAITAGRGMNNPVTDLSPGRIAR